MNKKKLPEKILYRRYPGFEILFGLCDTPEEAVKEVLIAKSAWLEAALAKGKPIPPPRYKPVIYQTVGA